MAARKTAYAYSRKTGLVTASVKVGEFAICTSVHRTKLDLAVDQFCAVSDGAGPLQNLLNDLLLAERDFAKPKPKGIQAGREKIVPILKFAAPWTFCFVREQWKLRPVDRHDCLRRAEIELKKHFEIWNEDMPREQLIEFTALLLDSAYGKERRQEGLISPSSDSWIPESYFRTYINPRLRWVQKRIDKKPACLRFPSNAYLREVFEPFGVSP